jgi:hypothetical protein
MASKTEAEAEARMAQDAWAMAVTRQRAAEDHAHSAWTMDAMARAAAAKKQQHAAWRVWQRAEARAEAMV